MLSENKRKNGIQQVIWAVLDIRIQGRILMAIFFDMESQ